MSVSPSKYVSSNFLTQIRDSGYSSASGNHYAPEEVDNLLNQKVEASMVNNQNDFYEWENSVQEDNSRMDPDEINDQMLIAAIRRRLLEEIQQGGGGDAASIVNNVYGSYPSGNNGITEGLSASGGGGGEGGQDPFDYFVDINRRDELNEEGEKIGWNKNVHRYRKKKAQDQLR